MAAEKIPEVTQLENEGKGHWVGGGYKNVIIKANHMEPKTLDPINRIGKATSELISFYINYCLFSAFSIYRFIALLKLMCRSYVSG